MYVSKDSMRWTKKFWVERPKGAWGKTLELKINHIGQCVQELRLLIVEGSQQGKHAAAATSASASRTSSRLPCPALP
jgi:hypothetical protein